MNKNNEDYWDLQEKELIVQNAEYQKVRHLYEKDQGKWIVFAADKCIGLFEDFPTAWKAGKQQHNTNVLQHSFYELVGLKKKAIFIQMNSIKHKK